MKSTVFSEAIESRKRVSFFYDDGVVEIEPYFLAEDRFGNKVIYGKLSGSDYVKKFEFSRISNLRIQTARFAPALPLFTFPASLHS